MSLAHDINRVVHITSGTLALVIGAFVLVSTKGGPFHRRWGKVFVALGLVNLVAAIIGLVAFQAQPALVAVTVAASYQYMSSLRSLALRHTGPTAIDALLTLAGIAACTLVLVKMGPGDPSWTPAIGYSTLGYALAVCGYDASRFLWRDTWRRVRLIDHGLKMTGFYFAMMSAGIGNLFPSYQPLSQVGPSALGSVVMIAIAIKSAMSSRPSRPLPSA